MNERIKELIIQSGGNFDQYKVNDSFFNRVSFFEDEFEKFIELIIKDCTKVADDTQFKYRNYPVSIAIEEYFGLPKLGVEE